MNKNIKNKILSGLFMLMLAGGASASLIGDTVTCSSKYGPSIPFCAPSSATVSDPGTEFSILFPKSTFTIDVSASQLTLRRPGTLSLFFVGGDGTEGITIGGIDLDVTNFAINSVSNVSGLTAANLTFDADSVAVALANTTWDPRSVAIFDIVTASNVPVPTTLALLGLGLAGLGLNRRKTS